MERAAQGAPPTSARRGSRPSIAGWRPNTASRRKTSGLTPSIAAPFIADKNSIQQGYVTSEPFAVEREGHFKPNIFLFADQGYGTYATTIETRADIVASHPDLVQRFVDASAIGWYNYLYGDNSKANAMIKSGQSGHDG